MVDETVQHATGLEFGEGRLCHVDDASAGFGEEDAPLQQRRRTGNEFIFEPHWEVGSALVEGLVGTGVARAIAL